ncbi:fibrillarin-like rRNA/tRNA 2'-O-methyltransferase [Methanocella arvoryzae]|uniref:Fibrillarin-like rRNA/tRNA 2'-O-methyltransferase n=1 Tax=Methanocella arvoryzae (strain DSM 22066 / NBRC 105507 / MRE50) TaxID=351160 RepID=Q0W8E6_METAR|nr:fibrillarin-like rRNA/tRNA 2'-O-methyltransferase [Methanocella arvoryzae]CAJ35347.1 fibrillarin-like pre-rRNA processing protein [Methanocella arvoryzae MRE50]
MNEITGIRSAGIDNTFYLIAGEEELLATRTSFRQDAEEFEGNFYRLWSPVTSKLSSMIIKNMKIPLRRTSRVLYLGAASGTTVTHVSDIVSDGVVFAVEFAARPARDLLTAIEPRTNVIPIIADARYPEKYPPFIDRVDFLYQDVAQPDQAAIAVANAEKYLQKGGHIVIAIKARSISITEDPKAIFQREIDTLSSKFKVLETVSLEPLHKDHLAVLCRY